MSIFHEGGIRASDQSEDAIVAVLGDVEAQLADVADSAIQRGLAGTAARLWRRAWGRLTSCMSRGAKLLGWPTRYTEFDKMTSGPYDSTWNPPLAAARPSMGKTAWAINIAQNAAVYHCGG